MIEDNEPHRAKAGETALHAVSRSSSQKYASEVSELLLAYGAKVNEPDAKGQTPLDEALANERNETAETLRNHGGKTDQNKD
jgi:ankyrin repeat protein